MKLIETQADGVTNESLSASLALELILFIVTRRTAYRVSDYFQSRCNHFEAVLHGTDRNSSGVHTSISALALSNNH